MLKRILSILILAALIALPFQLAVTAEPAEGPVRVASLKGPTTMGLSRLMQDESDGDYSFTVAGTADEIAPALAKGEVDIALIPCNLAAVLSQKMDGGLQVAAINTLGVLYVVEAGDTVRSLADLAGKTLLSTGKGTTPEYALNYVLRRNDIDPESDLTIDYRSEATEVAAALQAGTATLALLPQPFATAAMAQNPELRVALSLTDEWTKVGEGSQLITGVVAVRRAFAKAHPDLLTKFLTDYAASTRYVNAHPDEAAVWIENLGIAKAAVAEAAIPACNIVYIDGATMRDQIKGYLKALYDQNPASVGGELPDDTFYILDQAS